MSEKTSYPKTCPIDGVIDIISRKWSLLVINTLGNCRKARFKEILSHLKEVSPKTEKIGAIMLIGNIILGVTVLLLSGYTATIANLPIS